MSAREELDALLAAEAEAAQAAEEARAEAEALEELSRRKTLAALMAEHGEENVRRCDTAAGLVVVRTPTPAEYDRFKALMWNERERSKAIKILVASTVVHPPRDAFDTMLRKKPGIAEVVGNAALELAGLVAEEKAKK